MVVIGENSGYIPTLLFVMLAALLSAVVTFYVNKYLEEHVK